MRRIEAVTTANWRDAAIKAGDRYVAGIRAAMKWRDSWRPLKKLKDVAKGTTIIIDEDTEITQDTEA